MKILKLVAENFKKLTAVEITPDGNVITLAGDNGAGKSSVLDSIVAALAGKGAVDPKPVREGADGAKVVCQLPGLTVTRRFYPEGGSSLIVQDAEGNPLRTPQSVLSSFLSNLAFDPLAFSRLKPLEQAESLKTLVGLDFTKLNKDRADAYDKRTVVNREADVLKKQAEAFRTPPGVDDSQLPKEPVSIAGLVEELSKAEAHNAGVRNFQMNALKAQELFFANQDREETAAMRAVQEAKDQIAQWQKLLPERETVFANLRKKRDAFAEQQKAVVDPGAPSAVEPLKAKIVEAEGINNRIQNRAKWESLLEQVKPLEEQSNAFTRTLEELDAAKAKALADAKLPLPGITFNELGVFYNGVPFEQASDGEKLRISVAIGMALNPKLRVIFVRDGALLDSAGLKLIASLAKEHDYQVWLEDSRSTDPAALMMVDGHIQI
jgi:ABC-type dipeptide/oligopeptide/nickel transport system ATPase component